MREFKITRKTRMLCSFIKRHSMSNARKLSDVYGHYSANKERAYNLCIRKMNAMDGENFKIISHNTYGFVCGWYYRNASGALCMNVETPCHSYQFEV